MNTAFDNPADSEVKVSIEIRTFNNKEVLQDLLAHLGRQTYPADLIDVVLSDDGSSDGLCEMVEAMIDELPFRLKILKHPHKGPANAHNKGIEATESGLVIMLASDILASPQLVEEHVKAHQQHTDDHVVVSGKLVQSRTLPDTVFQKSWSQHVNRLFATEKDDLRHGHFFVSNLSFKKSFMLKHGMFLDWPPAAQEDLELGYRLKNKGMELVHNRYALGYHHHPVTLRSIATRAYTQGYNWHLFEAHVLEPWVRVRSGHVQPVDGWFLYFRTRIKQAVRKLVINNLTVHFIYIPLIQRAEQWRFLTPLVPQLASKVSVYSYYKGLRDQESEHCWRPETIDI